jgi:hypothetical protein
MATSLPNFFCNRLDAGCVAGDYKGGWKNLCRPHEKGS